VIARLYALILASGRAVTDPFRNVCMIDEYSIKPARLLIVAIGVAACGPSAHLPLESGIGPSLLCRSKRRRSSRR
jgi:hypothetical protein